MNEIGTVIAIIGAVLASLVSGIGSARGVGMVGEAAAGVVANDAEKFSKVLVLQLLPGTQGLYGLLVAILVLSKLGVLSGSIINLTLSGGLAYLGACLPIMIVGYFSAIAQGRSAVAGVGVVAKNPTQNGKAITMAAMVETYAILALLVSILVINGIGSVESFVIG